MRVLAALLLVLVAAGCGGTVGSTRLRVVVQTLSTRGFTLRCEPPGGSLPHAAAVCAAIARHRSYVLAPPPRTTTCLGGPSTPSVSWRGSWRGRTFDASARACDFPGGPAAQLFAAAAAGDNLGVRTAAAQLRCGELSARAGPGLAAWRRVRDCMADAVRDTTGPTVVGRAFAGSEQTLPSIFPRRIGRVACAIPEGGPAPGRSVPGMCTTAFSVSENGSEWLVLTERWDAQRFHGEGSPRSGRLAHAWIYGVDPDGRILSRRERGDFPPQDVR